MTTPAPSSSGGSLASNIAAGNSGLFVGVALIGGILLSGTPAAPLALGILSVGLIYQLQLLLQGK